jgi:hypothetical protein
VDLEFICSLLARAQFGDGELSEDLNGGSNQAVWVDIPREIVSSSNDGTRTPRKQAATK